MTHNPHHHPGTDLLLAYAAGTLSEAPSLLVATHLALCPRCRAEVAGMEAIGGALLSDADPGTPVSAGLLSNVLARLDGPPLAEAPRRRSMAPGPTPVLPEPLRSYIGGDIDRVRWRRTIPGLHEADISCSGGSVRMMRIRPGMGMPQHTHHGDEFTLVLQGGFTDASGHFLRGDFAATDPSVDHRPVADEDGDCICLAFTDAPLRLTGRFMRWLNPFMRA
ncbi:ChrR family anti-sigma-E factor [Niveispirillum sp.]|uniref:ChrR family anti-sigma-E factor n=1 Tax=Niveispirillum sp. TaxID=1917217 RepID=UPI001B3D320B|nr:ChrR family anti-sigma-E factor [Niveispirillum sp.]MBP7338745.1 ChrR family anti-sigma-E factor [Niveispirillum sp.]